MTFAFWFRSNGNRDYSRIIDFGNGPNANNIVIQILSSGVSVGVMIGNFGPWSPYGSMISSNVNDNVQRHWLWTLDPTGVYSMYMNGVLYATYKENAYYPNVMSRSTNYIGKDNWNYNQVYNGALDDFRYYPIVLTASQAQQIYCEQTFYCNELVYQAYYLCVIKNNKYECNKITRGVCVCQLWIPVQ